jgi:hypothetical protein
MVQELHEGFGGGHFAINIIDKRFLMQDIGAPSYFMMLLNSANLVMHVNELEV